METTDLLLASLSAVLNEAVLGPIVNEDKIWVEKLNKHRMRAQNKVKKTLEIISVDEKEGEMSPLIDIEIQHCAAVIAAAFLNPLSIGADFDRFAESAAKRQTPGKYFPKVSLGIITKPAILVDIHGKIVLWYLPDLLLPHRVNELNRVTKCLKASLCDSVPAEVKSTTSWRVQNFTCDGSEAVFGAGKLSLTVGRLATGRIRLEDPISASKELEDRAVQEWLKLIVPVEHLLDAVLKAVHPDMWRANSEATSLLLGQLKTPLPVWPTLYPGLDIIANRITPSHCDQGGALTFYDHLVNFGHAQHAQLELEELDAKFAYKPGTSVLFPGKGLSHAVPDWGEGERVVIAHYGKDIIQDKIGVARPSLPTQLGWWSKYNTAK